MQSGKLTPTPPGLDFNVQVTARLPRKVQVFIMVAIMGLGTIELVIVGAVILLLFGSRLPKVMRSLGQGIVEFKRGVQGIEDDGPGGRGDGAV